MTPERQKKLDALFHDALALQVEARAAFLAKACGADIQLRADAERLLAAHERESSFLAETAVLIRDDHTESPVGRSIGRYKVISQLGRGGMGEVYLAEDSRLDRKIALKVLPAAFTVNPDRVRRFEREAKAASALNHPNIITIHEIGDAGDTRYIATEFIEGQTLRVLIREGELQLDRVLDVAAQVASALATAHEAGILHRDIKPENIIVRPDGLVKVLDFGLAKLTERPALIPSADSADSASVKTESGVMMGTAHYMSPEQARGQEVDARTDIFSFGVVLYEMLTRHAPFAGPTLSDVIAALLRSEPPPLASYAPEIPSELERVVSKTLRKDREERYQSIKDLSADLKAVRQELEVNAKEPSVASGKATSAFPRKDGNSLLSEIKRHKLAALLVVIAAAGIAYYWQASRTAIDSIAVLPFANQNHDPDTEYLSDGLTESIINNLTQLADLRVIARSSAFRFKGKEDDPFVAGQQLGVRAVVVGRVLQRGEQLMVSAELVDVRGNKQLWGDQYQRTMSDLVAVQQEISREITEKLRSRLTGAERGQLVRRETNNAEAYQCYLRGRYYWNRRTGGEVKKALEQFQRAVDKDPTYALAYVGLADCFAVLEQYTGTPALEALPKAKAAALRALEIDDSLAEAHTSLGYINAFSWQFGEAEEEHKRGIQLNPNYPTAHQWYGVYLRAMGRVDEAMAEFKRAQQLDPLSSVITFETANLYLLKGDLDSAIEQCKKTIDLDPSFPRAYGYLGWCYLKQGREQEALVKLQKAVELSGRASEELGFLGCGYAALGRRAEAMAVLRELEEKYARKESPATNVAAVYAGLGEKDQAFGWLEKDFQARTGVLIYITHRPVYEQLRDDPRYTNLLRRVGLVP